MGPGVIAIGVDDLPRALAEHEDRFEGALHRGLRMGAERGRGIIVRRTPSDLGELRASWKVIADGLATNLINVAPHAGIVELGARPHKVSAEGWAAIYEWVRRHPELYGAKRARTNKRGGGEDAPFKGTDPEISSITWAIVKKINRVGQKPTYFVRDSMDLLRKAMIAEVSRALQAAMAAAHKAGV